jgi:hypothetical protein
MTGSATSFDTLSGTIRAVFDLSVSKAELEASVQCAELDLHRLQAGIADAKRDLAAADRQIRRLNEGSAPHGQVA